MKRILTIFLVLALFIPTASAFEQHSQIDLSQTGDDELFNKFRKEANTASFSVYPVYFTSGKPLKNVGDIIALFMEQAGMENVLPATSEFLRKEDSDFDQISVDFSEFIKNQKKKSDYSLYAEVLGSQLTGVAEVRALLVDKDGSIIWKYRSVKGSEDFKKYYPSNPMTCCVMISGILKNEVGLKKRAGFDLHQGNMTTHWATNSGIPGKEEQEAIRSRADIARKQYKTSSLAVFPVLYWGPDTNGDFIKTAEKQCAENIVSMLNQRVFASAISIACDDKFDFQGNSNQAKMLWTMANNFSSYLKKNPVEADYALIALYSFNKDGRASGINIVGCTGKGDIVEAALFNEHHKDFRKAKINSKGLADKFLAAQVQSYLK